MTAGRRDFLRDANTSRRVEKHHRLDDGVWTAPHSAIRLMPGLPRSLLNDAVAHIGGQARQSQGPRFCHSLWGMAEPRTQRVVMTGRRDE